MFPICSMVNGNVSPLTTHSPGAPRCQATLIFSRHGESEWNVANIFTGWASTLPQKCGYPKKMPFEWWRYGETYHQSWDLGVPDFQNETVRFLSQHVQKGPRCLKNLWREENKQDVEKQYVVWVNYNELTTSSLEIIVSKGNHPQMALIQVSELL